MTISPQAEAILESLVKPLGVEEVKERAVIEQHLSDQRNKRKEGRKELDKK